MTKKQALQALETLRDDINIMIDDVLQGIEAPSSALQGIKNLIDDIEREATQ